jgi:hypothetical protein
MNTFKTCSSKKDQNFKVQLFDDSDEGHETGSTKPYINDDDDDDDSFYHTRSKSQSSENLSMHMRRPVNVLIRRQTLDPSGTRSLRNYVRHRKETIVQRVIGYNYDDHSTAGGLYIRVGIGSKSRITSKYMYEIFINLVFCLGTVIHAGLSILSNLENISCARWTDVMDDFSRLVFSFIQFFFIFKHSNVCIYKKFDKNFVCFFLFS